MREIRTSGLMSGDGKRSDADTAQATAPVLDSTRGLVSGGFGSASGRARRWRGWRGSVGAWGCGDGLGRGTQPRRSGRQLGGAGGEQREAVLVGVAGRQRDLDPGGHLGDPAGDLDQRRGGSCRTGRRARTRPWAPGRAGCAGASRRRCGSAAGTGWRSPCVHEVRSEARCSLCALIRFSAWPRAQ